MIDRYGETIVENWRMLSWQEDFHRLQRTLIEADERGNDESIYHDTDKAFQLIGFTKAVMFDCQLFIESFLAEINKLLTKPKTGEEP